MSRRGTQIVVSAELIHGATGERLWGQTFDRPLADLMRVQDSIVMSIAEGLQLRLSGEEKARLGGFGTSNPEAYELFLKGRFLLQKDTEEDDIEARLGPQPGGQRIPHARHQHGLLVRLPEPLPKSRSAHLDPITPRCRMSLCIRPPYPRRTPTPEATT